MSAKITGMVWDLDLPRMEIQILLAMADHAHHDGTKVFPSQALIAWKTGYSIRQVRRVQDNLKQRKILIPEGSGYRGVQHYRLDFSTAPLKPPFVTRDSMSSEDKMSVVTKPHVNKLLRPTRDKMSVVTEDKMSAVPTEDKMSSEDISDTLNSSTTDISSTSHNKDARAESLDTLEPSEKETPPENANAFSSPQSPEGSGDVVSEPPKKGRQPRKPKHLPSYDPDGYQAFIAAFPRRAALPEAVKAWDWLKPDSALQATILTDIDARKAQDRKWAEGIITHPSTYLRGERWRDDIVPMKSPRDSPHTSSLPQPGLQQFLQGNP